MYNSILCRLLAARGEPKPAAGTATHGIIKYFSHEPSETAPGPGLAHFRDDKKMALIWTIKVGIA